MREIKSERAIETSVDRRTMAEAQTQLNRLGLSVQEAIGRMMEEAAKGVMPCYHRKAERSLAEKTMGMTDFRTHYADICAHIAEPDRVVLLTDHGRGKIAMMSVDTYRNLRAGATCLYNHGG